MRRAVWKGCIVGFMWLGSISHASSKLIALKCENNENKDKYTSYIAADTRIKSVKITTVLHLGEVDKIKKYSFVDGSYDYVITSIKIEALDGNRHDEYAALVDSDMQSRKLYHQHVEFVDNKVRFWTESFSNIIDMNGGIYTNAKGGRGYCDYTR